MPGCWRPLLNYSYRICRRQFVGRAISFRRIIDVASAPWNTADSLNLPWLPAPRHPHPSPHPLYSLSPKPCSSSRLSPGKSSFYDYDLSRGLSPFSLIIAARVPSVTHISIASNYFVRRIGTIRETEFQLPTSSEMNFQLPIHRCCSTHCPELRLFALSKFITFL